MSLAELRAIKTFVGRGGTDFRPAFAAAEKVYPRPDLLIYFTDGYGPVPDSPPRGMHTLWGLIPHRTAGAARPALWGDVVLISDDPNRPVEEDIPVQDDDE